MAENTTIEWTDHTFNNLQWTMRILVDVQVAKVEIKISVSEVEPMSMGMQLWPVRILSTSRSFNNCLWSVVEWVWG